MVSRCTFELTDIITVAEDTFGHCSEHSDHISWDAKTIFVLSII